MDDAALTKVAQSKKVAPTQKSNAIRFLLLIGIVSFFADFGYEGARSIAGPYLAVLGASATLVGTIAGLGELLGYGLLDARVPPEVLRRCGRAGLWMDAGIEAVGVGAT